MTDQVEKWHDMRKMMLGMARMSKMLHPEYTAIVMLMDRIGPEATTSPPSPLGHLPCNCHNCTQIRSGCMCHFNGARCPIHGL